MSQLQSDLRCVYGFSRDNAREAETRLKEGKLSREYMQSIDSLFTNPWSRANPTDVRTARYTIFNRLNYELSTEKQPL
jgi:hypothetical protein